MSLVLRKEDKVDRFVFYFCLVDILFVPYAFFMAISYSFFILMPWLLMRFNRLKQTEKEFQWFLLFAALVIISSLVGGVINGVLSDNISRALQIIQIMGYYFLFSYYLKRHSVNLKPFLLWFVAFVVVCCVLYNMDKDLYLGVIRLWNPRGLLATGSLYDNLEGYRYSFLWMDPNNIAYMFVALIVFLLTNERIGIITKLCLGISLVFVLISAMSSGGFISLIIESMLLVCVLVARTIARLKRSMMVKRKTVIMAMILMCLLPLIIILIVQLWQWYSQSSVAMESMNRINNNTVDSRIAIWMRILNNANFLEYLMIGYGGSTFLNGVPIKPHNGHFYMIMGFGFIAYFIFMYIIFRKRKVTPVTNYIWIIAVLLGFTVNIMIGEVKLSALIMLMVACTSSRRYLAERGFVGNDA